MLGITLLMLLGVEWVCGRVMHGIETARKKEKEKEWAWLREPDFDSQGWGAQFRKESKAADTARWEPYVYWRRKPFSGQFINIDARGIRRTMNNSTAPARAQIGMFGGSTLWGSGARDAHTIPSELAALFAGAGIPVEITNFGESGYVQTQEVISLLRAIQHGYRPRLVIFYDGVNDVFAAHESGVAGIPRQEDHRREEFGLLLRPRLGSALRTKLGNTALMQLIRHLKYGRSENGQTGCRPQEQLQKLAGEVVEICHSNVQIVDALAQQFGFEAVYFWQPVLFSKNRLSAFETAIAQENRPLKETYEAAYRRVAASPLARHGRFFNLADVFADVETSVFSDYCHLSEAGNARVARAIFASLQKLQLVR